jgi:hypothetical protein
LESARWSYWLDEYGVIGKILIAEWNKDPSNK